MATARFNGLDLSTLGEVDIDNAYRPFNKALQLSEAEAPGVGGSQLLLGGVRSQNATLVIRLRASGSNKAQAESSMVSITNTFLGLVGATADFYDPYGFLYRDTTCVAANFIPGQNYFRQNGLWYIARNAFLVLKRTDLEVDD